MTQNTQNHEVTPVTGNTGLVITRSDVNGLPPTSDPSVVMLQRRRNPDSRPSLSIYMFMIIIVILIIFVQTNYIYISIFTILIVLLWELTVILYLLRFLWAPVVFFGAAGPPSDASVMLRRRLSLLIYMFTLVPVILAIYVQTMFRYLFRYLFIYLFRLSLLGATGPPSVPSVVPQRRRDPGSRSGPVNTYVCNGTCCIYYPCLD